MKIVISVNPCPRHDIEVKHDGAKSDIAGLVQDASMNQSAVSPVSNVDGSGFSICLNITPDDAKLIWGEVSEDTLAKDIFFPLQKQMPSADTQEDGTRKQESYANVRFMLVNEAVYAEDRKRRGIEEKCSGRNGKNYSICKKSIFDKVKDFCEQLWHG